MTIRHTHSFCSSGKTLYVKITLTAQKSINLYTEKLILLTVLQLQPNTKQGNLNNGDVPTIRCPTEVWFTWKWKLWRFDTTKFFIIMQQWSHSTCWYKCWCFKTCISNSTHSLFSFSYSINRFSEQRRILHLKWVHHPEELLQLLM